jgi:hypothetical protein
MIVCLKHGIILLELLGLAPSPATVLINLYEVMNNIQADVCSYIIARGLIFHQYSMI